MNVPEALAADFASDPIPYGKVWKIFNDPASPLNSELFQFLASLPPEVIEAAYADSTFVEIYGKNENYARAWFAERLLIDEAARRRLRSLAEVVAPAKALPYSADCLRNVRVDKECMVRLANFEYNGSTLVANGFSFTVCPTNVAPHPRIGFCSLFMSRALQIT